MEHTEKRSKTWKINTQTRLKHLETFASKSPSLERQPESLLCAKTCLLTVIRIALTTVVKAGEAVRTELDHSRELDHGTQMFMPCR